MSKTRLWPLLVAFLLLSAACGQKAGVAGSGGTTQAGELTGGTTVDPTLNGDSGVPVDDVDAPVTDDGAAPTGGGGGGDTGGGGGGDTGGGGPAPAAPSGPGNTTGITDEEIVIGIHAPESGAAAVSTFREAVGVYAQWAGEIEGLGGRRIVVEARDDHFDPAEARRVCKELVEQEKVFLLIGGAGVDQIKSCAEYAASAGVPYFSPGVTEGPFRNLTNYFALSETYNQQNVQIAQLIKNQIGKTQVGMVLTDSPLLDETEEHFKAEAAKNGLDVVYTGRIAKDAGKNETDSEVTNLQSAGAEVVYTLISPTVFGFFVSSAKQQAYNPTYVAPGLSIGVNLVAAAICQPPFPDVQPMSPMVEMDVIDQHDPNYKPAYREKNGGGSNPDDIGILLWGLEKTIRLMMEAAGPDLTREKLIATLESGKQFASNVYAPLSYGSVPHFGAKSTTLLQLNCSSLEYVTAAAFKSNF